MVEKTSYSVSEILLYYFDNYNIEDSNKKLILTQTKCIGLFIHKILNLYYKYNKNFNILYFLDANTKNINSDEKNKIISMIDKLKEILQNKKWKILFYETNFFYENLYGKPDAIYSYNNDISLNYFSSSLIKYFYHIKSNCINKNIFLNSFQKIKYDETKNNIIVIDWKCSKRNIFFYNNNTPNDYLKHFFYNTLYNKFLIQMNIYKYILEKNKFKVMEMYICLLNIDKLTINFIPIYFLKEDFIENIINNYNYNKIFK